MEQNFIWNDEKHTYQIVNESLVDVAKRNIDFIASRKDLVILNDDDLRAIKKQRAELNNAVKTVADARKQMTAIALSRFAPQCKEIEQYGAKIAQELTEKINTYVASKSDSNAEVKFKLTITSKDKKAVEKVRDYALKFGCEIKEE